MNTDSVGTEHQFDAVPENISSGVPNEPAQSDAQPEQDEGREGFAKVVKHPATSGFLAGALVLGAAAVSGALETALGATAAYVAYRVLRRRRGRG